MMKVYPSTKPVWINQSSFISCCWASYGIPSSFLQSPLLGIFNPIIRKGDERERLMSNIIYRKYLPQTQRQTKRNLTYITLTPCMKTFFYTPCDHLNFADLYNVWRIELCNFKKGQEIVQASSISRVLSTKVFKISLIQQNSWSQGNS